MASEFETRSDRSRWRSRIGAYTHQVEQNRRKAAHESGNLLPGQEGKPWAVRGSSLSSYAFDFSDVLDKPLAETLVEHKKGQDRWILDLMADETVVREVVDLGYKGGLAVSLGFPPLHREGSSMPEVSTVGTINGDILVKDTWRQIRGWLDSQGAHSFDVVISRPVGGTLLLTSSSEIHLMLLRRSWELLSSEGGLLLYQTPGFLNPNVRKYYDLLKDSGIQISYLRDDSLGGLLQEVKIVKTPDSPQKLPSPGKLR